jgi:hypothetical protein
MISFFAHSGEEEQERTNQTMQDTRKSTNQSIQNVSQTTANETSEAFPI